MLNSDEPEIRLVPTNLLISPCDQPGQRRALTPNVAQELAMGRALQKLSAEQLLMRGLQNLLPWCIARPGRRHFRVGMLWEGVIIGRPSLPNGVVRTIFGGRVDLDEDC